MSSILENIKKMREQAEAAKTKYFTPKGGKNMSPKDFVEGITSMRVAPSHSSEFPLPFVPFRSTYLEVELGIDKLMKWNIEKLIKDKSLLKPFGVEKIEDLSDWDDDKLKSKLKEILGDSFQMKVNKKIFIATMHGKEGDKDLLEEYIKFVVGKVNGECERDEAKKKLSPIFGFRDSTGKWNSGINPGTNFVFYGFDWGTKNLFKVEIYDNMMDKIEELYMKFDTPETPLTIDPFSHPSEGIAIDFDKYKTEKGKWAFRITDTLYMHKKHGTYQQFQKSFELEEEQLKQLAEVDPLYKLFGRGSFRKSDFELQVNGLLLFDAKHEFNAFENSDFLAIYTEIEKQYEGEVEEKEEGVDSSIEETKSGSDIDKTFATKPLQVQQQEAEAAKKVEGSIDDEEAELKAALALIKKNKAKKAAEAKKTAAKKDDPLKNTTIEENSFKEDEKETPPATEPTAMNAKLAALRAKTANKK